MNHAQTYLKEVFGVDPVDERPTGIHGILHTDDYHDFTIVDDLGVPIHHFTGAKLANKCLPGDHVHWNAETGECALDLRAGHPCIVGTLAITSKTRYGLTAKGIPIYLFVPYDKSYPNFIVGCSTKDVSHNLIGIIKYDDWKANSTFPRGILQETLGHAGDYDAECQALIWQASPWKWPKGPYDIQTREKPVRHVLQGFTCNIDPEGCKDIDDVFTFEKINETTWKMAISISDVATYVENGSTEDILASVIGQTLYDPEGKVLRPMLPVEYSEKACSLLPGKESYGISLCFVWNGREVANMEWVESVFTNQQSFTYEAFQAWESEYREVLAALASHLAKESVTDSHEWVEQMMIFYNKEAGRLLKEAKMGILRRHSAPEQARLERYQKHAALVPGLVHLAMTSAEYCLAEEQETQHYGLESDHYAHASSPIRRYADLVNQRVLKLRIRGSKEGFIVPQAMIEMNKRTRAIKRFARDMDFLRAIQANKTTCQGMIVDRIPVGETEYRIRIYVPQWRRIISATYKKASENTVLSRDEKEEIDVTEFREVTVAHAFHTNLTNWKDRIIINIR
jgi:exoribonuclease R